MLVLGIESTCDETACALVKDGKEIIANFVSSQIDLHNEFGGVVPELACRRHVEVIIPLLEEMFASVNLSIQDVDLIAASYGPGLIGALLIGLNCAKTLSLALNKPFVGVNHVEAHLYAAMMAHQDEIQFPCLGAVLSGGHTALVTIHEIGKYELIGQTVDDAIGEAFDKTAKILGLPYPGGPAIEKLAKEGDFSKYPFKCGVVKNQPLDFSFSGIKTGVLYAVKGQNTKEEKALSSQDKADIAASFQHVALNDIVQKIQKACDLKRFDTVIFGGGVTNNNYLKELILKKCPTLKTIWPTGQLSLDNAAMIAGLGYHVYQKNGSDSLALHAQTSIPF